MIFKKLKEETIWMIVAISMLLLLGFLLGNVQATQGTKVSFGLIVFMAIGIMIGWALKSSMK